MFGLINLFIKGIFVGVANVIPGVSGGTIAVVLGIFDQMIDAINNFYKDLGKYAKFLVPLFAGAGVGIIIFSKLIEFCLTNYSFETSLFFAGLVIGSIPLILKRANEQKTDFKCYIAAILAFAAVVGISFLKGDSVDAIARRVLEAAASVIGLSIDSVAEAGLSVNAGVFVKFLLGALIASSAMVVPGISGSFVLVLLGMYNTVITSISGFVDRLGEAGHIISESGFGSAFSHVAASNEFIILTAVLIGVVIGIVLISKIIDFLFKKAYSLTYYAILGLIFASIYSIFTDELTFQSYPDGLSFISVVVGIITCAAGIFISLIMGRNE